MDRDGLRTDKNIICTFKGRLQNRFKGLVKLDADICLDNEIAVIPEPSNDNPYHAALYDDCTKNELSALKSKIIADAAELIAWDESVEWVSS